MGDRQNGDHFLSLIIAHYQNDRTGSILDAFLLPALMFGLPEV